MEELPNIYQRVNAIMAEISNIEKEAKLVNNQYPFVSHDTLTKKLQPHLVKAGVVVVPTVTEYTQNGNRCEATVRIELVNIDNPTDRYGFNSIGYGIDSQDKGPGKAISYAVKNGLLKAFQLQSGDKDVEVDVKTEHRPDNKTMSKAPPAKEKVIEVRVSGVSKVVALKQKSILDLAESKGLTPATLNTWLDEVFKIPDVNSVNSKNHSEIHSRLSALEPFEVVGAEIIADDIPF